MNNIINPNRNYLFISSNMIDISRIKLLIIYLFKFLKFFQRIYMWVKLNSIICYYKMIHEKNLLYNSFIFYFIIFKFRF